MDARLTPGVRQTWNRYAYALNNPLGYVDPDGLAVVPVELTFTGGEKRITYVDTRVAPRLVNLMSAAQAAAVRFTFNEAFRTQAQQDAIKTSNTKNDAGTSPHTAGLALDINVSTSLQGTDLKGLTGLANAAGLSPLKDQAADPPHFQANDLITRDKNGQPDQAYKDLIKENQQDAARYEQLRRTDPAAFEKEIVYVDPTSCVPTPGKPCG